MQKNEDEIQVTFVKNEDTILTKSLWYSLAQHPDLAIRSNDFASADARNEASALLQEIGREIQKGKIKLSLEDGKFVFKDKIYEYKPYLDRDAKLYGRYGTPLFNSANPPRFFYLKENK